MTERSEGEREKVGGSERESEGEKERETMEHKNKQAIKMGQGKFYRDMV